MLTGEFCKNKKKQRNNFLGHSSHLKIFQKISDLVLWYLIFVDETLIDWLIQFGVKLLFGKFWKS